MFRKMGLAATLATSLLLSTAAWAETELRITHAFSADKATFDAIVAEFEKANPDIKVKQIVFDDDQYSDTGLITQLKSDDVPDIYFQWAGFAVKRDAEAGYAFDLTDSLATDNWKQSFTTAAFADGAGTTYGGRSYLIPFSFDITNTIWYNQKIFEENKLTPPKTWADLVEAAKVLSAAGVTPIVTGNNEFWPLGNWASHIAARVVPPDEYRAAFERTGKFNTPGFERALTLLAELRDAGGFNKDMQGLGADPAMAAFFQEAAAMHPIGSWLIPEATIQGGPEFRYGQFDTPMIDESHPGARSVIGTFTGFAVHKNSKHTAEAVTFLKFFSSKEQSHKWVAQGTISPVLGAGEGVEMGEQAKSIVALLTAADSIVPPPDTTYPVPVAEAYYQAAARVASGESSPQEALKWLDETVAAIK
jgi:raffinose/stachyose/melibiose transport system substrate-binding protein